MSTIETEDLREIVEGVWMTVLDLPVLPGSPDEFKVQECITSSIDISGAWLGSVRVRATEDFLTYAASHVFMKGQHEVVHSDRTDTATELTNMIGGTVKCLLPETCDLSLPTILSESEPVDDGADWVYFSCNGYPLAIAVTESSHSGHKAA